MTSKKVGDRILIEKASAFWVKYNGQDLKVTLAMTDPEKEEVWQNRDTYIGRMIEYKGMLVGAKDVPRHPGIPTASSWRRLYHSPHPSQLDALHAWLQA